MRTDKVIEKARFVKSYGVLPAIYEVLCPSEEVAREESLYINETWGYYVACHRDNSLFLREVVYDKDQSYLKNLLKITGGELAYSSREELESVFSN